MFSATKLVGLAAIVALVGGALAIGGPLTVRQDEPPLAATAEERVEFIGVRGTMEVVWGEGEDGDCELGGLGGVMDCRGGVVSARYDWDDDRLDGVLIVRSNRFDISSTPWAVLSLTQYLENDGGAWVGDGYAYSNPWTQEFHLRTTLDGTGDYDGLTAILDVDESTDPSTLVTTLQGTGVIVGPGLPEPPEPATQELLYQHIDQ